MKETFKYLADKHAKLMAMALLCCIGVLILGALYIDDYIQKSKNNPISESTLTPKDYGSGIRAYDVEGLSDEEIYQLIEDGRK